MQKEFSGKTVLITGGSRGLGAGLAQAFAERGADVAISYANSSAKAEAVVDRLKASGVRAIAVHSDQSDLAAAQPLVDRVIAQFGKLDIVVHNAGITRDKMLANMDEAKWGSVIAVNIEAQLTMNEQLLAHDAPCGAPVGQRGRVPAGQLAGPALGVDRVRVVEADVDARHGVPSPGTQITEPSSRRKTVPIA